MFLRKIKHRKQIAIQYPSWGGFLLALFHNSSIQMKKENVKTNPESCMSWQKQLKCEATDLLLCHQGNAGRHPGLSNKRSFKTETVTNISPFLGEIARSCWREKAAFEAIIAARNDGKSPWRNVLCHQTQFSVLIKSHMDEQGGLKEFSWEHKWIKANLCTGAYKDTLKYEPLLIHMWGAIRILFFALSS